MNYERDVCAGMHCLARDESSQCLDYESEMCENKNFFARDNS
jgi:hypothetical protein